MSEPYVVYTFTPEIMSEGPWIRELLSELPIRRYEERNLRTSRTAPPGRKRRLAMFFESLVPGRLRPARRRVLKVFAPHNHCICVYNTWFIDRAVRTELGKVLSRFDDVGIVSVDESSREVGEAYARASFAVRIGFGGEEYRDVPNLVVAPLGVPMQFVAPSAMRSITERRYAWAFLGEIKNPNRQAMVNEMEQVRGERFVHLISTWNADDSIRGTGYSDILGDSVFVPSPPANVHEECYRTYEALECDAIPVVDTAYYRETFGAPFPVLQPGWANAAATLNGLLEDTVALERLHEECRSWWQAAKRDYRRRIRAFADQAH
jgi:hypothetical protein